MAELTEELGAERKRAGALTNDVKRAGKALLARPCRIGTLNMLGSVAVTQALVDALLFYVEHMRYVSCHQPLLASTSAMIWPSVTCLASAWKSQPEPGCYIAEERLNAARRREEAARQRAEADVQLLQQRLKAAESKVSTSGQSCAHMLRCFMSSCS